jgi:methionyl-tRNA formyltransferase
MNKNVILIINRDDILFLKPLEEFLIINSPSIKSIYYTSFFPVGTNKLTYILANLKIASLAFLARFIMKTIENRILSVLPMKLRNKKNVALPLLCKYYNIPCKRIKDLNSSDFIEELKRNGISIVLSLTSHIYKKEILSIEGLKVYNFHPSLLPQNKGRFPIFWAFMSDSDYGLTCHEIEEKIDSGKIINQKMINVPVGLAVEHIMEYIIQFYPQFMDETLRIILSGDIEFIKPVTRSFYGPIPTKEDIGRYKRKLKNRFV